MAKTKTVWDAFMVSEDESLERLGQVAIDDGMLSVVSLVDEDDAAYVQEICDEVNGMEELIEKAPPGEGAERYEIGMKTYSRSSPDFEGALIRKLEKGFALKLQAPE